MAGWPRKAAVADPIESVRARFCTTRPRSVDRRCRYKAGGSRCKARHPVFLRNLGRQGSRVCTSQFSFSGRSFARIALKMIRAAASSSVRSRCMTPDMGCDRPGATNEPRDEDHVWRTTSCRSRRTEGHCCSHKSQDRRAGPARYQREEPSTQGRCSRAEPASGSAARRRCRPAGRGRARAGGGCSDLITIWPRFRSEGGTPRNRRNKPMHP